MRDETQSLAACPCSSGCLRFVNCLFGFRMNYCHLCIAMAAHRASSKATRNTRELTHARFAVFDSVFKSICRSNGNLIKCEICRRTHTHTLTHGALGTCLRSALSSIWMPLQIAPCYHRSVWIAHWIGSCDWKCCVCRGAIAFDYYSQKPNANSREAAFDIINQWRLLCAVNNV